MKDPVPLPPLTKTDKAIFVVFVVVCAIITFLLAYSLYEGAMVIKDTDFSMGMELVEWKEYTMFGSGVSATVYEKTWRKKNTPPPPLPEPNDKKSETFLKEWLNANYAKMASSSDWGAKEKKEEKKEKGTCEEKEFNTKQHKTNYGPRRMDPQIRQWLDEKDKWNEIHKHLNEHGGIDLQDSEGKTILHHATINRCALRGLLVKYGANPNIQDNTGSTPLHYAARIETNAQFPLKELLENGADKHIRDNEGRLPMDVSPLAYYKTREWLGV